MYSFMFYIYSVFALLFIIISYKKNGVTPAVIFVSSQLTMIFGIVQLADVNQESDMKLIYIYFIALILFIIGVFYSDMINGKVIPRDIRIDRRTLSKSQRKRVIILIMLSVLLISWFFTKTDGNVFILMLKSFFQGGSNDFTDQRLSTYSVIGSGYVYQFRVIILPVLTAYLISVEKRKMRILGFIIFPIMIIFLLGTGQRGGFVIFILIWCVSLVNLNKYYDENNKKKLLIIAIIFLALFAFTTFYNGRSTGSGDLFNAIKQRFVSDNQISAIIAFRYINILPTQYGKDWLYMFDELLPGKSNYITMASRVFQIMYGSTDGTAPPCIWGSVYYNWGYVGVIIVPWLLGFLYQNFYYSFAKNTKTKFRLFTYSAMSVCLGFWTFDAPVALFNDGFIVLLLLQFAVTIYTYKHKT